MVKSTYIISMTVELLILHRQCRCLIIIWSIKTTSVERLASLIIWIFVIRHCYDRFLILIVKSNPKFKFVWGLNRFPQVHVDTWNAHASMPCSVHNQDRGHRHTLETFHHECTGHETMLPYEPYTLINTPFFPLIRQEPMQPSDLMFNYWTIFRQAQISTYQSSTYYM